MPLNPEQIDNARLSEIFFRRGTDVNPRRDVVGAESRTIAAVLPHPASATTPAKINAAPRIAFISTLVRRREGICHVPAAQGHSGTGPDERALVSREPS